MNEPGAQVLMDQDTIQHRVASEQLPKWGIAHYENFRETLLGEHNDAPFPCYFGIETEQSGTALYTFCASLTDKNALIALGETLLEYLDIYEDYSERAPLTAFFKPSGRTSSEADYHEALWHILQFLHVHDPEPWPTDIPTNPDTPRWEFCFGGEPIFPTSRAPFYDERTSRSCPIGLEITFQPRGVFHGVTADTDAGQSARETIQDRLADYDGVCPHANIGDWGVEGDREWHQYLLPEDSEQAPSECPIKTTRKHPKALALID